MKIVVAGATGKTGSLVLEQGLARGHHLHALARKPADIKIHHPNLTVSRADLTQRSGLDAALDGCDAVVSALGVGTSREPTLVYSAGVTNLLSAMATTDCNRIVVVSAVPAGPRDKQPAFERHVVMPILDRFFGTSYEDMRKMEAILAASTADWTSLRPPRLLGKPATGKYRLSTSGPLPRARSLRYGDLATAMLDAAEGGSASRSAAYIAN